MTAKAKRKRLPKASVAEAGVWYPIGSKQHFSICCDCGLVHKDEFGIQLVGGTGMKPEFRLFARHWRDPRKTAAKRREKKRRGEKLPGEK
jgi:hypothetical protein